MDLVEDGTNLVLDDKAGEMPKITMARATAKVTKRHAGDRKGHLVNFIILLFRYVRALLEASNSSSWQGRGFPLIMTRVGISGILFLLSLRRGLSSQQLMYIQKTCCQILETLLESK